MIGLTVLAIFLLWLFIAWKLAGTIAGRIKSLWVSSVVAVVVFFSILLLPFVDQWLGQRQFKRLCEAEAKVWVSPTAKSVQAAQGMTDMISREGLIFPVTEQSQRYVDVITGEVFYRFKSFHTKGGFVMRAGLGLGHSTSCWPKDWGSKDHGLDLDILLKRGEATLMEQRRLRRQKQ
jgi:hypothetical protein